MTSPATAPRAPAPSPANALTRVEQKLDKLEQRLAFLDQMPAVLEAGVATADDLAEPTSFMSAWRRRWCWSRS